MSEYAPAVRAALAEFVDEIALEGRGGTARSYHHQLQPLARLELDSVAEITPQVCRELLAERVRTTSGGTAATFAAVLRSFTRWCVARRYLLANPTDGIRTPKQRRPPHRWLTAPQLRAMFEACTDDTDRLILLLCGGSGLRSAELLGLKWRDVDTARGEIRVLGKGRKWRTLRPGALAMAALGDAGDGFVLGFRSRYTLRYHVEQIAKRAGVAYCTTHMLRHSFAVNYLQRDGSAFGLQQLLGHANATMTQYYVRDAAEELARCEQERVDLAGQIFG